MATVLCSALGANDTIKTEVAITAVESTKGSFSVSIENQRESAITLWVAIEQRFGETWREVATDAFAEHPTKSAELIKIKRKGRAKVTWNGKGFLRQLNVRSATFRLVAYEYVPGESGNRLAYSNEVRLPE